MAERIKLVKKEAPSRNKIATKRLNDNRWLLEQADRLWCEFEKSLDHAWTAVGELRGYETFSRVMGEEAICQELMGMRRSAEKIIRKLYG